MTKELVAIDYLMKNDDGVRSNWQPDDFFFYFTHSAHIQWYIGVDIVLLPEYKGVRSNRLLTKELREMNNMLMKKLVVIYDKVMKQ